MAVQAAADVHGRLPGQRSRVAALDEDAELVAGQGEEPRDEGGVASRSPAMRPDDSTDPGEPGAYDAVDDTLSRNGGSFTCVMSTVTLPVPIPSPPLPWEPVLPSFNV